MIIAGDSSTRNVRLFCSYTSRKQHAQPVCGIDLPPTQAHCAGSIVCSPHLWHMNSCLVRIEKKTEQKGHKTIEYKKLM
jgi:hypothetical protein